VLYFKIRNFEKYQHGHTRDYPWIKLYKSLLTDGDFIDLPVASKWHYIGLLIVASTNQNCIRRDSAYIRQVLQSPCEVDLTPLFQRKFLLACRKHSARKMLQREEKRTEEKSRVEPVLALKPQERAGKRPFPTQFVFTTEMRDWANQKGCRDAARQFEQFQAYHVSKNTCFSNWEMAWRNWILKGVKMEERRHG